MIKEITHREDWNKFLLKIEKYDFYHTYGYHQTAKNTDEIAVLLVYDHNDVTIGFP